MKEKVCFVLDDCEGYAMRLTDYINEKQLLPYTTMAFSSYSAVSECIDKYNLMLLISGMELDEDQIEKVKPQVYIQLSEVNDIAGNTVWKYQSADNLLKDVISHIDNYVAPVNITDTQIIGVYSPAGACFKTTMALSLAINAAKSGRCLYINFEQFAGLGGLLPGDRGGLSEALYYYKLNEKETLGKIMGCMDKTAGFDYLAPVKCPEDIYDLSEDDIKNFISLIAKDGGYSHVIIDWGNTFGRSWIMLECCHRIIMPEARNLTGQDKIKSFMDYVEKGKRNYLKDKIEKVSMPYMEELSGAGLSMNVIMEISVNMPKRWLDG